MGTNKISVRFERPEIIRPPSEWRSYYLPLTSGCSNHTCTFCNYYGRKLKLRDVQEVKEEIDALYMYKRYGMVMSGVDPVVYYLGQQWDGKRIFLQDGDALVYPYGKLLEALEHLNRRFPDLERVSCYATPQDILRRSVEELRRLRELKLTMLYLGLESGSDEILERVRKGVNSAQMIEAAQRAKEAGMVLSVTVILGLGGVEKSQEHARATARVLSRMDPEYAAALTLLFVPGTPLYRDWKEGRFRPVDPFGSLEELRIIVEDSEFTNCFFSSMHASNYVAIKGWLPREKERLLRELDAVLGQRDPSLLRPEHLRAL